MKGSSPRGGLERVLYSGAGAALLAGCLVVLNLLAGLAVVRLDFSQGRAYSLSSASKSLLGRLEDPLYVRVYFSKTLPTQFAASRDYASSLLKEYRQHSRGKLRLSFVDVETPEKKSDATREGITPVRFNIISRERYEVREALMGLVLQYQDRKEVIPFIQDTRTLEYDLSSRIKKLTASGRKTIGFVTAGGARGPDGLPEAVLRQLEPNYDTKVLDMKDLKPEEGLPAVDAALLLGPTQKLTPAELYRLDQFLLSGRPVAVGLDAKRADMRSFVAVPLETGAADWAAAHGVKPGRDLVLDLQNQKVQVSAQQGWIQITNVLDYPPFVLATSLAADHPLTRGLDSLSLPFPSPLELEPSSTTKAVALAQSSPASWIKKAWEKGPAVLNPFSTFEMEPGDKRGPFILAAAVEGRFTPAFPAPPPGVRLSSAASEGSSRLVVVGTSHFLDAQFPDPPSNRAFALNLVDWLVQDADLIAIRAKGVAYRHLRELPAGARAAVKYADIFCPPLLVVGAGLARWRRRRNWKRRGSREYGGRSAGEAS